MRNEVLATSAEAARLASELRSVLCRLPRGGLERRAVEAGEIDAVIDYGSASVIVFPAAQRALREAARCASAADRRAALDVPGGNHLLAALPRKEYRRLLPALEPVVLEYGDVVHDAGGAIRHVYFPVDSVIRLMTTIDDHRTVATGLVGYEGMLGLPLALEVGVSLVRAVVQVAGRAMRMPASRFTYEFQRGLQLQSRLYGYAQAQLDQARQTAACISAHLFQQRLACWLLMVSDRAKSQRLFLTQEQVAAVFHVRRVSVTMAASALRSRGLITYSRGMLSILDRNGLALSSCCCYRPIEATMRDGN